MGTLGNISGKEAAKAFGRDGWIAVGQVGKSSRHEEAWTPLHLVHPSTQEALRGNTAVAHPIRRNDGRGVPRAPLAKVVQSRLQLFF